MKPFSSSSSASALCERILHGEGAMLKSLKLHGPTSATLRVSVQDKHRGFDWIDVLFEMNGMSDARLVDEEKLGFVDTNEGITILFEEGVWGLGVGRYGSLRALGSAPLYLVGTSLKYEEAPFSG